MEKTDVARPSSISYTSRSEFPVRELKHGIGVAGKALQWSDMRTRSLSYLTQFRLCSVRLEALEGCKMIPNSGSSSICRAVPDATLALPSSPCTCTAPLRPNATQRLGMHRPDPSRLSMAGFPSSRDKSCPPLKRKEKEPLLGSLFSARFLIYLSQDILRLSTADMGESTSTAAGLSGTLTSANPTAAPAMSVLMITVKPLTTTFTPPLSCGEMHLTQLSSPGYEIWLNEPQPVPGSKFGECYPTEFAAGYTSGQSV